MAKQTKPKLFGFWERVAVRASEVLFVNLIWLGPSCVRSTVHIDEKSPVSSSINWVVSNASSDTKPAANCPPEANCDPTMDCPPPSVFIIRGCAVTNWNDEGSSIVWAVGAVSFVSANKRSFVNLEQFSLASLSPLKISIHVWSCILSTS